MNLSTRILGYVDAAKITRFSIIKGLSGTTENSLRVILNRLVKQGRIYNPVRGLYVSKNTDPFVVAATIYPGYISLSSAFYLHNLIDEYPFTLFIASEMRKSIKMGQQEFFYFKAKNYLGVEEGRFKFASIEKAIYDSMSHPDLVSAPMLVKVLYNSKIKSSKFISLSKTESGAFFQKLGYFLSILPRLDSEKKKLMVFCSKRKKSNAYLNGRSKGRYIKDWKIIDNVGKEVLLSWLHQ